MILKQKHTLRNTLLLVVLLLVFAEVTLRIVFSVKNYPIGKLAPAWMAFQPIDTLVEQQSFFTDEHGIYKMKRDFWEQQHYTVNSDNFRGREFISDTLKDSTKSILFIGDSFVWGFHATPIDSCFVDLLDRDAQLICYNAGIPGTDPAQYAAIAALYVPKLLPDFTVVAIYLGNDLMSEQRAILPNQEQWYQTNAGWLPASYKGKQFSSAQESYKYLIDRYTANSLWKKALLKTALGTAMLTLPLRLEERKDWMEKRESDVTNQYLNRIKLTCEKNNSRLLVFIIPGLENDLTDYFFDNPTSYVDIHYPKLRTGLENSTFIFPVKKEFYHAPPDGHFNNHGHRAAAEFIRSTLSP